MRYKKKLILLFISNFPFICCTIYFKITNKQKTKKSKSQYIGVVIKKSILRAKGLKQEKA